MVIEAGQQLLHYRLIKKIGEGGMGVVWKALDTSLDGEVATKILPETLAGDTQRIARLEREAKLLATLNHESASTTGRAGVGSSDLISAGRTCRLQRHVESGLDVTLAVAGLPLDQLRR